MSICPHSPWDRPVHYTIVEAPIMERLPVVPIYQISEVGMNESESSCVSTVNDAVKLTN